MSTSKIGLAIISIVIFLTFIYYNYSLAQKSLQDTREAPLSISLISYPELVKANSVGSFVWRVDATSDKSVSDTTIYWGYVSSPSAVTKNDSPMAVGYPYSRPDYTSGDFRLPQDFAADIKFDRPGTIYFRGFAKVGDNYLWTDEKSMIVSLP